jgi:hypothetical protein
MKKVILIGILAVLLIPRSSLATTYTFDDQPTGLYSLPGYSNFNDLFPDSDGVTFSNEAGFVVRGFSINQPSTDLLPEFSGNVVYNGLPGQDSIPGTVATFSVPINYVSVTLGDYNGDAEILYLAAYRGSTQIGFDNFENPASSFADHTLIVSATGIEYVIFGSRGSFPNTVYWDNFVFEQRGGDNGAAVPEPSTMLLLGTGLLGLVGIGRRKLRS